MFLFSTGMWTKIIQSFSKFQVLKVFTIWSKLPGFISESLLILFSKNLLLFSSKTSKSILHHFYGNVYWEASIFCYFFVLLLLRFLVSSGHEVMNYAFSSINVVYIVYTSMYTSIYSVFVSVLDFLISFRASGYIYLTIVFAG